MSTATPTSRSLADAFTAKGLRLTAQRRVLLEIIESATSHLDAAGLLQLARDRDARINRATVYRTLEILKKPGLIDELDLMHLNGEKHYYEIRTGRDHIHLACFECGRIEEYESPVFDQLKQEIAQKQGFSIGVVRMEVGGRCSICVRANSNSKEQ